MLVESEADEHLNTPELGRMGRGAAARSAPTPCGATAAVGERLRELTERMLASVPEGAFRV